MQKATFCKGVCHGRRKALALSALASCAVCAAAWRSRSRRQPRAAAPV